MNFLNVTYCYDCGCDLEEYEIPYQRCQGCWLSGLSDQVTGFKRYIDEINDEWTSFERSVRPRRYTGSNYFVQNEEGGNQNNSSGDSGRKRRRF